MWLCGVVVKALPSMHAQLRDGVLRVDGRLSVAARDAPPRRRRAGSRRPTPSSGDVRRHPTSSDAVVRQRPTPSDAVRRRPTSSEAVVRRRPTSSDAAVRRLPTTSDAVRRPHLLTVVHQRCDLHALAAKDQFRGLIDAQIASKRTTHSCTASKQAGMSTSGRLPVKLIVL